MPPSPESGSLLTSSTQRDKSEGQLSERIACAGTHFFPPFFCNIDSCVKPLSAPAHYGYHLWERSLCELNAGDPLTVTFKNHMNNDNVIWSNRTHCQLSTESWENKMNEHFCPTSPCSPCFRGISKVQIMLHNTPCLGCVISLLGRRIVISPYSISQYFKRIVQDQGPSLLSCRPWEIKCVYWLKGNDTDLAKVHDSEQSRVCLVRNRSL